MLGKSSKSNLGIETMPKQFTQQQSSEIHSLTQSIIKYFDSSNLDCKQEVVQILADLKVQYTSSSWFHTDKSSLIMAAEIKVKLAENNPEILDAIIYLLEQSKSKNWRAATRASSASLNNSLICAILAKTEYSNANVPAQVEQFGEILVLNLKLMDKRSAACYTPDFAPSPKL